MPVVSEGKWNTGKRAPVWSALFVVLGVVPLVALSLPLLGLDVQVSGINLRASIYPTYPPQPGMHYRQDPRYVMGDRPPREYWELNIGDWHWSTSRRLR